MNLNLEEGQRLLGARENAACTCVHDGIFGCHVRLAKYEWERWALAYAEDQVKDEVMPPAKRPFAGQVGQ